MSAKVRYVRPEEIMEAVEFAKKKNPKDVSGELAFKLNTDSARSNKDNTVTYYSWEVNILNPDGSRSWVPVKLTSKAVNTCSNIKHEAGKGVQLQFRRSSKGSWTIRENGKPKTVDSPFGEAVFIMTEIFPKIVKKKIEKGDISTDNTKISIPTQIAPKDPKTKKPDLSKKFEDPIIRITIPFPKKVNEAIKPDAEPSCKIYDIERPFPAGKTNGSEPAYFLAEYKKSPEEEAVPLNYTNISEVIKYGSSVTSIIDFASPTVSGMGISMTPKFEMIMVKRSKGREINVMDAFGEQLDDLADTSNVVEPSPDAPGAPSDDKKDDKPSNITNDDLDDLDNLQASDDLGDL